MVADARGWPSDNHEGLIKGGFCRLHGVDPDMSSSSLPKSKPGLTSSANLDQTVAHITRRWCCMATCAGIWLYDHGKGSSETDSKVIFEGHEINVLSEP